MELPDEDAPPEEIWLDQEAINDHFQRVKDRHSSGARGESMEELELDQNDLTKGLKK